ncbi:uncharacterized protein LOC135681157 isoform X2 [Rhopilema esculentum]|eukprot:gene13718-4637_t
MPSRKFSVNSQFSSSSVKTSGSSSNEISAYRRAASVHEINELYAALNELINSPPTQQRRNTGDSVVSGKSSWSSDSNLLENEANHKVLTKRANSESSSLRPSRSASCLSSKSCYASICTNTSQISTAQNTDSQKSSGIYSKLVAKIRGKKAVEGKRGKANQKMRKSSSIDPNVCVINGKPVKSIEDLIELANSKNSSSGTKTSAKDKRKKFKTQGRSKANSFDSSESNSLGICVHKVSSKLRTWYTRAASIAATIEDEARSRAESSMTASSENFLDDSPCEMNGGDEVKSEEGLALADFDVSNADALELKVEDSKQETNVDTSKEEVKKNVPRIDLLLKRSYSSYDSSEDVFLCDKNHGVRCTENSRWKSDNRCDLIRRLSLNIVEDVLAGKSASCGNIGKSGRVMHHPDLGSNLKVQQWLKDLDSGRALKSGKGISSQTAEETIQKLTKLCHDSETAKEGQSQCSGCQVNVEPLQTQPLFYIPNFNKKENDASVNMIIPF